MIWLWVRLFDGFRLWVMVFWLIMLFQWRIAQGEKVTQPKNQNLKPKTIHYNPYSAKGTVKYSFLPEG